MIIRYYGLSCFLLYSKKKSRILTDPFSEKLRYFMPPLTCEIVVISHEHQNHSAFWRIIGEPYLVKRTNPGACELEIPLPLTHETFVFKGIPTFHDESDGKRYGPNTVFVWEMDELRICHLGDLGHALTPKQRKNIGPVDVLFLPVGGGRVLDSNTAAAVAAALEAKVIFPMHFDRFQPPDAFLKLMPSVKTVESNQYEISSVPSHPLAIQFRLPEGGKLGS